jgi:hypothetical protein
MRTRCWGFVLILMAAAVLVGEAAPVQLSAAPGTITITAHAEYPSRFFREFYREFGRLVEQWWEQFGKYDSAGHWEITVWETVLAGQRLPIVIGVAKDGDWLVKPLIVPREDSDPLLSAHMAADKTMQKIDMWGWKRDLVKRGLEEAARRLSKW